MMARDEDYYCDYCGREDYTLDEISFYNGYVICNRCLEEETDMFDL